MVNRSIENGGSSLTFLDLWKCHDMRSYHDVMSSSAWILSAWVVAASVLLMALKWRRRSKLAVPPQRPGLKRSVSFISSMMAAVVLPDHVNMPEPVINIFIEFEACPTQEDLMTLVVAKLLQYDRLAKIPILDSQQHLCLQDDISYDCNKLVRRVVVHEGEELHKVAQKHLHDPLNDPKQRGLLPWWEILILDVSKSNEQS
jgi:hypothetical protein